MANNCTVLLLQQNDDGTITSEIYHWDNRPEGETVPPNSDIRGILARKIPADNKFTFHARKSFPTRTVASATFAGFMNANYSDTPA